MTRPKVLVTRKLPQEALALIEESCDLDINREDRALSEEELKARIIGKHGLVCLLTDRISEGVIATADCLKIIANMAVGYDNIALAAAAIKGVTVTNTPGVLDEATADLTWALLMAAARRIVEADRFVRQGLFKEWRIDLLLGADVYGKTLGLVGLGRIGQRVARRALGFEMKILYHARHRAALELEQQLGARYVTLPELLKEADFISLHVPLTRETFHLISGKELSLMKPTAYLINTSRGPVVDEPALVQVLKQRRIAGAALDVYEAEPALAPGLIELDNVVLAPHIGSATAETRRRMAVKAAENLLACLKGERPPNLVLPSG